MGPLGARVRLMSRNEPMTPSLRILSLATPFVITVAGLSLTNYLLDVSLVSCSDDMACDGFAHLAVVVPLLAGALVVTGFVAGTLSKSTVGGLVAVLAAAG